MRDACEATLLAKRFEYLYLYPPVHSLLSWHGKRTALAKPNKKALYIGNKRLWGYALCIHNIDNRFTLLALCGEIHHSPGDSPHTGKIIWGFDNISVIRLSKLSTKKTWGKINHFLFRRGIAMCLFVPMNLVVMNWKISKSLKATRFVSLIVRSLWDLTGTLAAVLLVWDQISNLYNNLNSNLAASSLHEI